MTQKPSRKRMHRMGEYFRKVIVDAYAHNGREGLFWYQFLVFNNAVFLEFVTPYERVRHDATKRILRNFRKNFRNEIHVNGRCNPDSKYQKAETLRPGYTMAASGLLEKPIVIDAVQPYGEEFQDAMLRDGMVLQLSPSSRNWDELRHDMRAEFGCLPEELDLPVVKSYKIFVRVMAPKAHDKAEAAPAEANASTETTVENDVRPTPEPKPEDTPDAEPTPCQRRWIAGFGFDANMYTVVS